MAVFRKHHPIHSLIHFGGADSLFRMDLAAAAAASIAAVEFFDPVTTDNFMYPLAHINAFIYIFTSRSVSLLDCYRLVLDDFFLISTVTFGSRLLILPLSFSLGWLTGKSNRTLLTLAFSIVNRDFLRREHQKAE